MGRTKCFNREDVLDKAIQVFWRQGFAETSLQDLEKATGVNKSGLYSEFKDKEDLFLETMKRYQETSVVPEILSREPLGLKNIETFLKASSSCRGEKGCYFANTMRELSIVPPQVKKVIFENKATVASLVKKNLEAEGLASDVDKFVAMILTFNTGISLKLNVMKPKDIEDEIEFFLENLRKLLQ